MASSEADSVFGQYLLTRFLAALRVLEKVPGQHEVAAGGVDFPLAGDEHMAAIFRCYFDDVCATTVHCCCCKHVLEKAVAAAAVLDGLEPPLGLALTELFQ